MFGWKDHERVRELSENALRKISVREADSSVLINRSEAAEICRPSPLDMNCLKNKARQERNREESAQKHWFDTEARPVMPPETRPDCEPVPVVDHQSRLDAILDLLLLGSNHYSNKR